MHIQVDKRQSIHAPAQRITYLNLEFQWLHVLRWHRWKLQRLRSGENIPNWELYWGHFKCWFRLVHDFGENFRKLTSFCLSHECHYNAKGGFLSCRLMALLHTLEKPACNPRVCIKASHKWLHWLHYHRKQTVHLLLHYFALKYIQVLKVCWTSLACDGNETKPTANVKISKGKS